MEEKELCNFADKLSQDNHQRINTLKINIAMLLRGIFFVCTFVLYNENKSMAIGEKINKIENQLKENNLTWSDFARKIGKDPRNIKRNVRRNLDKIDGWLIEIGLITKIANKK